MGALLPCLFCSRLAMECTDAGRFGAGADLAMSGLPNLRALPVARGVFERHGL